MRAAFILFAIAGTTAGVWQCVTPPKEIARSRPEVASPSDPAVASLNSPPCLEVGSVAHSEPPNRELEFFRVHSHARWHEPRSTLVTVVTGDPPRPVPDTEVWVIDSPTGSQEILSTATGPDGSFRVETHWPRGSLLLLRRHGFLQRIVRIRHVESSTVHLSPGLPVQGEVRIAHTGVPAVGAQVYVWDALTKETVTCDPTRMSPMRENSLITDSQGRFEIEGVRAGRPLLVCVLHSGYAVYSRTHDPASSFHIEIGRGVTVEGRVLAPRSGPAASCDVFLEPDLPRRRRRFERIEPYYVNARTVTDDQGRYRFEGVERRGRYVVTAKRRMVRGQSEAFRPGAGGTHFRRDVVLRNCSNLLCTVSDSDLEHPDYAPVTWRLERTDGAPTKSPLWAGEVRTGVGRLFRGGLVPGDYQVEVTDDDGRISSQRVTLAPGRTRRVELRLR